MRNYVHVILWGEEIGSLVWRAERRNSYFVYNPAYLSKDVEPFPFGAPKSNQAIKSYEGEERRIYQHLPAFIADSLPDDWGNVLFQQWVSDQTLSEADVTPLDKLVFIGKRGMGALEFEPDNAPIPYKEKVNIGELANLAHKIFVERENAHILPDEMLTKQLLIAVGSSAGGRQPKAVIAIHRETGEIRSGQVAGLEGYDYYILKFGDHERSTAELEQTYYEMAIDAGIDMMPCRLMEADGEKHFLTKRFDRAGGEKLHTQTLAAMDPDANTYEQLLLVCRKLHLPDAAADEVFRRMVFNYLANNTDDHHKNFSFLMNKKGEWSLAPAYDMTYIFNRGGYQPESEHCLLLRGKYERWTKEDVKEFAVKYGINDSEKIIRKVVDALILFRTLAEKNGVRQEWIGRIEATIHQRLQEWGFSTDYHDEEWLTTDGKSVAKVYLEQAYKGNYHLFATIDGKQRKFIIRKDTPEHELIEQIGIHKISSEQIRELLERRIKQ
ncbi:MAG: type II toxin-antitoxin system HipA family toxin [Paludibacteraceae bacterium]|nr:type II toxin-antitoxin system HipA family toxin [Paludibacteraceae bacterium]